MPSPKTPPQATVQDVIDKLQELPADLPVVALVEGAWLMRLGLLDVALEDTRAVLRWRLL